MKIGIVTINDYLNYGNRLQNFALQYVLMHKVELDEPVEVATLQHPWSGKQSRFLHFSPIKAWLRRLTHPTTTKYDALYRAREHTFKTLSTGYINESPFTDQFDKYIVGSDQVWNPVWLAPAEFKLFLLADIPAAKSIAYAASMGVPAIENPAMHEIFTTNLPNFGALSVREASLVDYIKSQTNLDAQLVLDPTLLLTPEEWYTALPFLREPSTQPPYALEFFIGAKPAELDALEAELTTGENLAIRALNSYDDPELFSLAPGYALHMIKEARIVVTDSYHAVALSILFGKPFIVTKRGGNMPDMSARITDLLALLAVTPRSLAEIAALDYDLTLDYQASREKLAELRTSSLRFLQAALKN
ncbi:MAG: polysaccharide pyruvyl transferase family protein [Lactobacillaceae bacterium]|jgi:hypothetical protein|nr:polysaccharide pyruvyl transferase family protein [Lactobacillaceae bacterium]